VPNLPRKTNEYIEYGAPNGDRNNSVFLAAGQFRDAGDPISRAFDILIPRALDDGLPESEARRAIESAYRGQRRDPIGKDRRDSGRKEDFKRARKQSKPAKKVEPKPLPDEIEDGALTLIKTCFKEGDWIAIGDTFQDKPSGGTTYEYEFLLRQIKDKGITKIQGDHDVFIRVNPVVEDGKSNKDVTDYRHVLVEFDRDGDGNPIPKDLQYGAILDSGMPVAALIDSGNKSIHAWIKVEAQSEEEYKERVSKVWDHFAHQNIDPQNRNSSRYSRCPGVKRLLSGTGAYNDPDNVWSKQKLLAVNFGSASWDEWESEHLDGLPAIESGWDFYKRPIEKPIEVIHGVLRKGCKMILGGPSKSRKSWIMEDLMLAFSIGGKWMGLQCGQGKVLYVNLELQDYDFKERLLDMVDAKFTDPVLAKKALQEGFDVWNLAGRSSEIEVLVDRVVRRIQKKSYDMIIVDPIYKTLGKREENAAGDMNDFLSHIERLAEATGAAVVIAHHFPKGNPRIKDPMDRMSGSGVFVRSPDAIVIVSPEPVKGSNVERFSVHFGLRAFKPMPHFFIKWEYPLMVRDEAIYAKEPAASRVKEHDPKDMLGLLESDGDTATRWALSCRDKMGISEKTFYNYLSQLKTAELVEQDTATKKYRRKVTVL
jgi:RecA-family ATPase